MQPSAVETPFCPSSAETLRGNEFMEGIGALPTAAPAASTDTSRLRAFRNCCHAACLHSWETTVFRKKNVCHCEVQINAVVVNLTITPPGSRSFFFFYRIKLISLTFEAVNEGLAGVVETEELCSGCTRKTSFCCGSHLAFIASTFFRLSVAAIRSLPSQAISVS